MAKSLNELIEYSTLLASLVTEYADVAAALKQECGNLKLKTEEVTQLLGWLSGNIEYDRPVLRILNNLIEVLLKALSLVEKCATSNPLLLLVSSSSFTKILLALENCIGDVKWLRAVIQSESDALINLPIPSIATKYVFLAMIWSYITKLYHNSPDTWGDTALKLLSLSEDYTWRRMIILEGGLVPLLKVLKHGTMEAQECAAKILSNLGRHPESVEDIINADAFSVFAKILKDGPMKDQAEVASTVFKLTEVHPRCQDIYVQNNIVRLLINHLSFEMIQDHTQNFIPINKATSVLAIVRASSHSNKKETADYNEDRDHKYSTKHSHSNESFKNKQLEDPNTKSLMKAEAAKALWQLVKGNVTVCQIIIESRVLMCFITLLKKGPGEDVQYASIMALMEITAIAEQDADLRRSTFKPSSPSWKAVIDILGRTIQRGTDSSLLIPSVKAIGNLARTFRATNLTIISSLVELIDESETEVVLEVLNALQKFCNRENHLHLDNCKAIISVGGVRRLVRVASIQKSTRASSSASDILSKIATNVPGDKELVDAGVHTMLKHAHR